jgi:C-terminal processing protease CtpA/Prc
MELNFTKTKTNLMPVNFIYRKILKIYSFLTLKERNIFIKKSEKMINKFKKGKLIGEETIKRILSFVDGSGHADIREYQKPDRDFMRKVKPQRIPSFKIEDRILTIKIPSWLIWLGAIDKKLKSFCKNNIKKYDAIIIDVRENNGGSSNLAYSFASIFFKKSVIFGKTIRSGKNKKSKISLAKLEPDKKIFIDKPIIILISGKSFSSTELFLAPFKVSKRAVLIGEPTQGGSARPVSEIIVIDGKKFVVRIPTWRFFLKGKKLPIEKTKIHPDILYKGKDIENFAEKYLLKTVKNV